MSKNKTVLPDELVTGAAASPAEYTSVDAAGSEDQPIVVPPLPKSLIGQAGNSSAVNTAAPISATVTYAVTTTTTSVGVVVNLPTGAYIGADGGVYVSASTLFPATSTVAPVITTAAPSTSAAAPASSDVLSEKDPSKECAFEDEPSSLDASCKVHDPFVSSGGPYFPASTLFNNLINMEQPMWNVGSQSPVTETAAVPSCSISAADPVGPSDAPQQQVPVVTLVKKAKFVGADGKLSCPAGIPIDLTKYSVVESTAAAPSAPSDVARAGSASMPAPSVAAYATSTAAPSTTAAMSAPSAAAYATSASAPSTTSAPVVHVSSSTDAAPGPGDLFHEFEGPLVMPLSWAPSSTTGKPPMFDTFYASVFYDFLSIVSCSFYSLLLILFLLVA